MIEQTGPCIVAVGGGKGGVGKSIVSINIAAALAETGARVALVDADLGAANLHTLFAIHRPERTIHDLLEKTVSSLEEVSHPTALRRLYLLPGRAAAPGAANIAHQQKQKLLRAFRKLDADYVVLDVGAGVSFNVVDTFEAAEHRLVVATPQLTSLENAYGFVKSAVHRSMQHLAMGPDEKAALEAAADKSEVARIQILLKRLADTAPELERAARIELQNFGMWLVGNQIEQQPQRSVVFALSRMIRDFLEVNAPVAGCFGASSFVHRAVMSRRPPIFPPGDANQAVAAAIAETIVMAGRRKRPSRPAPPVEGQAPPPVVVPQDALMRYARSAERHAIEARATLEHEDVATPCTVLDVSSCGALIDAQPMKLPVGTVATLVFGPQDGNYRVPCVVRRHDGESGGLGVEIHPPLTASQMERLLEHRRGEIGGRSARAPAR